MTKAVLQQIEEEREGNMIDLALLSNIVQVYVALSSDERTKSVEDTTCFQQLQSQINDQAQFYYQKRATAALQSESFSGYMRLAKADFNAETKRCSDYLKNGI